MKPKSAIDICNMALAKLGEPFPISSINPNGLLPERCCYMYYHPARREALCACTWAFAIKREWLSTSELHPGENKFTIPNDCLRILSASAPNYVLRNRAIYCDCKNIHVRYIADIEDVTQFSSTFTKAFATLLAAKLCMPLTRSTNWHQTLVSEYQSLTHSH